MVIDEGPHSERLSSKEWERDSERKGGREKERERGRKVPLIGIGVTMVMRLQALADSFYPMSSARMCGLFVQFLFTANVV